MNKLLCVGAPRFQAFDTLVIHPFLGGENEVETIFGVLKSDENVIHTF